MKIFVETPKFSEDYDTYAIAFDRGTNTLYLALKKNTHKMPAMTLAFEGEGITELKDLVKALMERLKK